MHSLMNATGAEFDWLFLEQMTVHHEGAVERAGTEIAEMEQAAHRAPRLSHPDRTRRSFLGRSGAGPGQSPDQGLSAWGE